MNNSDTAPTRLLSEMRDRVLLLTIDGPATRNSIDRNVYSAVADAMISAGSDKAVGAVIITGSNGFFTSGGNIDRLRKSADGTPEEAMASTDALNAMILAIRNCPKPVVAAVEGGAVGAGFSLALSCDFIIASKTAKFIVSYVRVGLTPDGGVTHFLSASLPRQLLSEMCLLGQPVPATRLEQTGVVNKVTDEGAALGAALDLAEKLAAGPSNAMAVINAEIAVAGINSLAEQLELEAANINRARFGTEAREGLSAFVEKRKPDFSA